MKFIPLAPGVPCPCNPSRRYVRFVVPAVPGIEAAISCRDVERTGRGSTQEHAPPRGALVAVKTPNVDSNDDQWNVRMKICIPTVRPRIAREED